MCYNAAMKAALALLLIASPAIACDWKLERKTDPMTDVVTCWVYSPSAKVSFYKHGSDPPNVATSSAYRRDGLTIRIDDNPAIRMGEDGYSRPRALAELLPQLQTGKRIRTQFLDYPASQNGDAAVCNIVELLNCN